MPRPSRPWFRFYVEAVTDRKIRRLTPAHRWLWVCILAAARQSCIPGWLMVSERVAYSWADLADFSGMRLREVEKATDVMSDLGMIEYDPDLGAWFVPKWNARQFESDDVTARTAKHRSKEHDGNVPTTPVGTPPETETETESDRESKRKRATQLPEDWEPPDETKQWVRDEYPHLAKRGTVEAFRDHYRSKEEPRKDWNLTFRGWVRREHKFHPPREERGPARTFL